MRTGAGAHKAVKRTEDNGRLMGSEQVEMGKCPEQDTGNAVQTHMASSNKDMQDNVNRAAPSLEETQSWAKSFEHLIKSPNGRNSFRHFLKSEFSEENLLFWLACEDLKKETNRTVVEQTVKQIYEDYVSVLSPREVSLDSHAREVISKNMLNPSSQTFDEAQQQIYTLMQRDSYPRYMSSSVYADLIASLETAKTEES
ncbi:hypothetical protein Q7C36_004815 [Tachysurus vachellii]|uniref:RGS domain-containing protein n=1 Tax=Tachysurus vachellii TaxID=175792 RepID=A0AA88NKU6_TACVA|nr:hypothetical protein Q7C36_004815 [Tachysurus vachellii]